MHQAAGGVVDIDEQRALRTAILEPPMLGTVDLHQLTQTITPCPRLVDALQSVFSPNPKTGTDHPLPQRLDAEVQAMKLRQLLRRQGRTKIRVAFAHNGQHRLTKYRTQCSVAGPATLARNQPIRPAGAETHRAADKPVFAQPRSDPWRPPPIAFRQRHRSAPADASARCGSS
jgi:hypothetical protein